MNIDLDSLSIREINSLCIIPFYLNYSHYRRIMPTIVITKAGYVNKVDEVNKVDCAN